MKPKQPSISQTQEVATCSGQVSAILQEREDRRQQEEREEQTAKINKGEKRTEGSRCSCKAAKCHPVTNKEKRTGAECSRQGNLVPARDCQRKKYPRDMIPRLIR